MHIREVQEAVGHHPAKLRPDRATRGLRLAADEFRSDEKLGFGTVVKGENVCSSVAAAERPV